MPIKGTLFTPRHRAEGENRNKTSHDRKAGLFMGNGSKWHEIKTNSHDNTLIKKLRSAFCLGASN